MKIAYGSDLHLEFFDREFKFDNLPDADVLVLAGDICVADTLNPYHDFFSEAEAKYEKVFYVLGNHEHYHGQIDDTREIIAEKFSKLYPRITILDNDYVVYEGVTFIGTTLWGNIPDKDVTKLIWGMNDYRVIGNGDRKLHPSDTNRLNQQASDYIRIMTMETPARYGERCVVITHHAPSYKSMHPKYAGDSLNSAFLNDLDDLILQRPNIALWIHGHTHDPHEYVIGNTRVVCNPKGYPGENKGIEFKFKVIEV